MIVKERRSAVRMGRTKTSTCAVLHLFTILLVEVCFVPISFIPLVDVPSTWLQDYLIADSYHPGGILYYLVLFFFGYAYVAMVPGGRPKPWQGNTHHPDAWGYTMVASVVFYLTW